MNSLVKRWRRNKIGSVGGISVLAIAVLAVLAPSLAPHSPTEMAMQHRLEPPSRAFLFGTDNFGRDILSRVWHGASVSLWVGLISVGIGVLGGLVFGLAAGFYGGTVDSVIMRFADVLFAFPSILLALVVIAVLGPSLPNTMVAIGVIYIPVFTRVVRASVLAVKSLDFVEAARAFGAGDGRLMVRHILPNVLPPLIVQASLALSGAILTEAALSFLGLGIQPPHPSWGSMLSESRRFMELAPWTAVFPALAIMVTVLAFNLFGDGLRDVLDPRLKR